jgi:chemotaxis protein methyltransferase CheR
MYRTQLEDNDFKRLATFITTELGIKMPDIKRTMLQSRLQKRVHDLQKQTFKEYLDFVFSRDGLSERIVMMDIVTTNKTDFFRESLHFNFLEETVLPDYIKESRKPFLKIWSAGCSSGEEPYTIGIVLSEFRDKYRDFDFQITGTDISTRMIKKAETAIYAEERVAPVDDRLKKKYLLKSKNDGAKTVRIVPELRSKVSFAKVNFMDDEYSLNGQFDIIFCRNVLIYFDRKTQEDVINKLCKKLKPGGYFFLGHSESITNYKVPLRQVKSTVFIKN